MDKNTIYTLIFLGILTIVGGFYIFGPKKSANNTVFPTDSPSATMNTATEPAATASGKVVNMEGLKIEDERVGTGGEAVAGKSITVNYSGTLTDGTKFDSSYDRGTPFTFNLGAGEVIQGWDKGFAGMKVGGKRKLTIPPELGYGAQDMGSIPPNSTLIFEVELFKVE